ncbi:MAG: 50S ribosomal protein L14 [Methanosarcinales archaeon]|uniref:Large ribosomal subunit protein uL14 n=1 Tax=Candidatus Ethanoperedens thermophilum TaxID=2766897 RepID=A0A848DBK4_9EURY|nr:50S ribosomal protein L14 [Candidatus Ethanoperedens thermophilum]
MIGLKAKIPRSLGTASRIQCADNTGAKVVEIISVKKYRGVKNRHPRAGIGDMIVASVKKGTPEMRKQIVTCVVIRQKKEFRRPDGIRVSFEDNAVVLIDETGIPKGSEIKGPVAKELADRFPKITSTATIVV